MRRFVLFLAVVLVCSAPVARAETRVALLVGNSAYQEVPVLANPANDTAAIAKELEAAGFEVQLLVDAAKGDFDSALRKFARDLKGASVGLFYYAGHGLQVKGTNYLVPVDAHLLDEADLAFESIDINLVMNLMESAVPTSLIFLDACRDNPFSKELARSMGTRSSALGRGLAQVETGIGTLIVFSTQPGNVALDGQGTYSPFAQAMLANMSIPGLEIRQVLSRVRENVIAATNRQQVPWDNSSLTGDFYLVPAAASAPAPSPAPAPLTGDNAAEIAFWDTIKNSDDWRDFQAYINRFGSAGIYYDLAILRLEKLKSAEEAQQAATDEKMRQQEQQAAQEELEQAALARVGELPPVTIQYALQGLGLYSGRMDGQIGQQSRRAISAFQRANGWAETGELTPEQTVTLFANAAEKGHAQSQVIYGFMFASGIGVPQDYTTARQWFGAAADQGDANGLYNLALLYRDGLGGDVDLEKAKTLLQKAAKAGHGQAKEALAALG